MDEPRLPVCGETVRALALGLRWIRLRVTSATVSGSTPDGWIWLHGYELDHDGQAICRRTCFAPADSISYLTPPATRADNRARIVRAARRNAGPARIPQQRTTRT